MKKIILTLSLALMGTGCVMSPDGNFYPSPNVGVGVGGASVDITPRVFNGSRSNVTVWLHPTYSVADAYPIAQQHCNRWGFYARPSYDWSASARIERRLNYTCVRYRPVLSGPHVVIGSPFYRNHYRHWHTSGRGSRVVPRRGRFGRARGGRVITPKPNTRYTPPARRRGTLGRIFKPTAPRKTVIQRGKPWQHNRNKNVIPNPGTTVQRGKPWQHNKNKNKVLTSPRVSSRNKYKSSRGVIKEKTTYKSKTPARLGYGSTGSRTSSRVKSRVSTRSKKGFGNIKPRKSSRRSGKGRLTL